MHYAIQKHGVSIIFIFFIWGGGIEINTFI